MLKATTYLDHIKPHHMNMTGLELSHNEVGCPTCASKLVQRFKYDSTKFIACDKTNRRNCPFSIGIEETLMNRSARIYSKFAERDYKPSMMLEGPRVNIQKRKALY